MTASTRFAPGRSLPFVKYGSTCPECQQQVAKGDRDAWYVPKSESHTGRGQVFCNLYCAIGFYKPLARVKAPATPEPIKIVPEATSPEDTSKVHCRALCGGPAAHETVQPQYPPLEGYVCSLEKGHDGWHEAWTSNGTHPVTVWDNEEGNALPVPTPEELGTPGTVTINGVEISTEGKHKDFALVLQCAAARTNVLLVGPAGSGKSTLAKQVHEALALVLGAPDLGWCSYSLCEDTPSSRLFGYKDANGVFQDTPFYRTYTGDGGPAGTILVDELDNGSPNTVTGLNQALANGEAAFANGNADRHEHATVLATANTFGKGGDRLFVSRQELDAASLDRFVQIFVDYDEALETSLTYEAGQGVPTAQLGDLLSVVRYARSRAAEKKLPLVFGPRACIDGAKLLKAGVPFDTVLDIRVFAGVSQDVRAGLQ